MSQSLPASDRPTSFMDRLLPAPVGGGFRMEGYWVWCGSVIRGDDGKYHMFASRWRQDLAFSPHWLTNSEVVRAEAAVPEGPYQFREVVLPARGEAYWDGRMTHNPTVHRAADGRYLLFYTGTTYDGRTPLPGDTALPSDPAEADNLDPRVVAAHRNQRIGLATASSPTGPWTRRDQPILQPRAGKWDSLMTTNPAPCVTPSGRVLLIYKSVTHLGGLMHLGIAAAEHPDEPFERLRDEPIFRTDQSEDHVEDPYLWYEAGRYHMLAKDMRGGLCGEYRGGMLLTSVNGIDWPLDGEITQGYSRTVRWDDGTQRTQNFFERPQLLIQHGRPTHLFAATAVGSDHIGQVTRTWNMVIPLKG